MISKYLLWIALLINYYFIKLRIAKQNDDHHEADIDSKLLSDTDGF